MPKIVRFHETGGADVLKIEQLPLTEPGEGEVRLQVEAFSLNRGEVMFREGQYLYALRLIYQKVITTNVRPGTI